MFRILSLLLLALIGWQVGQAQCEILFDEIDEFDSTRLVAAPTVSLGHMVVSGIETDEGPLLIDEAKALFTYSQNDSMDAFFLTLAVQEHTVLRIDSGMNVLFALSDTTVTAAYNVSDRGVFDKRTNLRRYQHTTVIPTDLFYRLTRLQITKIRINYKGYKRTIPLSEEQQLALQKAIQCVGLVAGHWPVRP